MKLQDCLLRFERKGREAAVASIFRDLAVRLAPYSGRMTREQLTSAKCQKQTLAIGLKPSRPAGSGAQ